MKNCFLFLLLLSVTCSFAQNKPTHPIAPYQTSVEDKTFVPNNNSIVAQSPKQFVSLRSYINVDFEDPAFPPTGWELEYSGTLYWSRETTASGYGIGTAAAKYNCWNASTGTTQSLISNTIAATTTGDVIIFDEAYAEYSGSNEQLEIYTSTDNGATFTLLIQYNAVDLITSTRSGSFTPNADEWATKTNPVPAGTNKIKITGISAFGNNIWIDNIKIGTPPANDVGMTSIDFMLNQQPGVVVPKATVKNFGSAAQSFNVQMTIGAYTSTKAVTTLAPGTTLQVTFDNWNATLGNFDLKVYTQLAGDADPLNDTLSAVVGVTQSGWMLGADINVPTYMSAGCATIFNGTPLLFSIGGNTNSALNTEVNKYDIVANTWTAVAPLPIKRVVMSAAATGGKVYVFGGSDGTSYQNSIYKYDIATDAWTTVGPLPNSIGWTKSYPYQDSLIYVVGGLDNSTTYQTQVLLYNINTDTYRQATGIPLGTFGGALAITGNTIVYTGGATSGGIVATTYVGTISQTDRTQITWETKASYPLGTRYRWDAGAWADGIIVAGGSPSANWTGTNECYVYKPATDTWIPMPNRATPILGASVGAVQLANGGLRYIQASGYDGSAAVSSTNIFFDDSFTPVELTSFTGAANQNNIVLNWSTATETNNSGFYVEKKSGSNFISLGFVSGKGTTTEVSSYSYTDRELTGGTYTYRLKQVDFSGSVSYSPEINVDMNTVSTFNLSQNYPNPFNPSTAIKFSIAVDSKVTLKIFNLLGQEVFSNIQDLKSGYHTVNFNASSLSSGVYFYRLEAKGANGADFTAVKKMTLIK